MSTGGPNYHRHEYVVVEDPIEHVPLAVALPGVDLVEELHPDKGVEEQGPVNGRVVRVVPRVFFQLEERFAVKQENEHYDQLVEGVTDDVFEHCAGDEGLGPAVWLPAQQILCRRFSSEGQGGERVHDEIYPQHGYGP